MRAHCFLFLVPLLVSLVGCAQGLDRRSLERSLAESQPVLEVTDDEIGRALALRPQLELPARIGIHFEPYEPDDRSGKVDREWTLRDKDAILSAAKELRASGFASDVFMIADSAIPVSDPANRLRSLRLAAARHGADALLVIRGAVQVDEYVNALSIFYPTLVGMLLPGSHCDALFLVEGTLWDVRNQYLYMTEEADGQVETIRPLPMVHPEARVADARLKALEAFRERLLERWHDLQSRATLRQGFTYATEPDIRAAR